MMGDDSHDDTDGLGVMPADPVEQHRTHHAICRQLMQAREDAEHAAAIRAMQAAARAFDADRPGCRVCGAIDAKPCALCALHQAADAALIAALPGALRKAAESAGDECVRSALATDWSDTQPAVHRVCRCGPDGCADSACPGRCRAVSADSEGGEI